MSSSDEEPNTGEIRPFPKEYLWLSGILLLSASLRFWHLDHCSLWESEIINVSVATQRDLSTLLSSIADFSPTPPLGFLVLRFFLGVLGYSDFVARLPAALLGILSVWLVYVIGRCLFDGRTGLTAALLLAISPFHIQYTQEVGPYSAFLGLASLSFLWFYKALEENSLRAWVGHTAFTTLTLYTHHFGVLLIAVETVFLVWARQESRVSLSPRIRITRREGTETSSHWWPPISVTASLERGSGSGWIDSGLPWRFFLSAVCTLILYAPWLFFGLRYAGPTVPAPTFTWSLLADVVAALSGGYGASRAVYAMLFAWGCLALWSAYRHQLILLLLWLILPLPLAVTALRWANLSLDTGSLIFLLPAYLLVVSRGVQSMYDWGSKLVVRVTRRPMQASRTATLAILVLSFAVLNGPDILDYYRSEKTNWRALAVFLDTYLPSDHIVVLPHPKYESALREMSLRAYLRSSDVALMTIEDPPAELEDLWGAYQGIWFIGRGFGPTFQVRKQLTELETPVVHLIFGRNDGRGLAQRIAPAAFGDIHVLHVSRRFKLDDSVIGQAQLLLQELEYSLTRHEFTLAEVIRQYGPDRRDSLALYDEALRDAPDYLGVYIHIIQGNIYRSTGEVRTAIQAYQAALALNPRAPMAHYGLALAHEKRGQRIQAVIEWETYLRLAPTDERAEIARQHLQRLMR
jgi:tetratricopeptide (TPR) repeat protein